MPDDSAKQVDDALFRRMPADVRALNRKARGESRRAERYAWATAHPNNPRVAGKKLNKP